jgi:5'-nucleotidase
MGRSLPSGSSGTVIERELTIKGRNITAYAVGGSPAQAVQHGVYEIADRWPSLVVSGINYGENVGNGVTISGTVGAAIEAACLGIPAIAVSLQVPQNLHASYSLDVNFGPAAHFTRMFAEYMLSNVGKLEDVDVLKIEVPTRATNDTDWKLTRISRKRFFWPTRAAKTKLSDEGSLGYANQLDPSEAEPDSDIYVVLHEGLVAVSPLSFDMSARVDRTALAADMTQQLASPSVNGRK